MFDTNNNPVGFVEKGKSTEILAILNKYSGFIANIIVLSNIIGGKQECSIHFSRPLNEIRTIQSSDLHSRVPSTDYILSQLLTSEEYTSAVKYNRFNSKTIMDQYLEPDIWSCLLQKTVDEIKTCSIDAGSNPSKNSISIRSRKYCQKKYEMMLDFIKNPLPPIESANFYSFEIEWKATLSTLVYSFFSILHRTISRGRIDLVVQVTIKEISANNSTSFIPSNSSMLAQNIYYISGYLVSAAEKEADRGGGNTDRSRNLDKFVDSCVCMDKEEASKYNLPIEKVKRMCAFGGLKYVVPDFFVIVCFLESVYSRLYSNENLLIYGDRLHLSIHTALKKDTYILDKFMFF